jgi:hypothetical protein
MHMGSVVRIYISIRIHISISIGIYISIGSSIGLASIGIRIAASMCSRMLMRMLVRVLKLMMSWVIMLGLLWVHLVWTTENLKSRNQPLYRHTWRHRAKGRLLLSRIWTHKACNRAKKVINLIINLHLIGVRC